MKIATWNINSIRARQDRLLGWLASARPDVLCLQETKCTDQEFPSLELRVAGYHSVCLGQKSYNGVAILSKSRPENVLTGMGDDFPDSESRIVAATVDGVRVICLYAPNGQTVDSPAYRYKLEWFERLRRYLSVRHHPNELLVACGDFNVAPEPRDVYDPLLWEGQTLFTIPERESLKRVCEFGLIDTFRQHHPEECRYTWWDYRMLAFPKNRGLRIDHLYATRPLAQQCLASDVDREARKGPLPSDHAPVWSEFERRSTGTGAEQGVEESPHPQAHQDG